MSKPAFSKKRKGKTVDPYPLGKKAKAKTKQTKKTRGRPRKVKMEQRKQKLLGAKIKGYPVKLVYIGKDGKIRRVEDFKTTSQAQNARIHLKTEAERARTGVYDLETGKIDTPIKVKKGKKWRRLSLKAVRKYVKEHEEMRAKARAKMDKKISKFYRTEATMTKKKIKLAKRFVRSNTPKTIDKVALTTEEQIIYRNKFLKAYKKVKSLNGAETAAWEEVQLSRKLVVPEDVPLPGIDSFKKFGKKRYKSNSVYAGDKDLTKEIKDLRASGYRVKTSKEPHPDHGEVQVLWVRRKRKKREKIPEGGGLSYKRLPKGKGRIGGLELSGRLADEDFLVEKKKVSYPHGGKRGKDEYLYILYTKESEKKGKIKFKELTTKKEAKEAKSILERMTMHSKIPYKVRVRRGETAKGYQSPRTVGKKSYVVFAERRKEARPIRKVSKTQRAILQNIYEPGSRPKALSKVTSGRMLTEYNYLMGRGLIVRVEGPWEHQYRLTESGETAMEKGRIA